MDSKNEDELLEQVRQNVHHAAKLLKTLGPDKARIGWLLEDTLTYLDEIENEGTFRDFDSKRSESSVEKLNKIANLVG